MTGARGGIPPAAWPLLPLFGLDVLTAFTVGMVPPLLPRLAADWALSPVAVGLVNTVYAVGRLGTTYPASQFRARWGTRAVVFLGVGVLIAGTITCGLAPVFAGFLVGRFLMGIGASAAFLAVFAELLDAAPAAWRGRVANAFEGMAILSLGVGGALAGALASATGWRAVFWGSGPVLLLTLIAWRPLGPLAGRHRPTAGEGGGGEVAVPALRRLVPVYAAGMSLAMTWSGLFATLAPLLGEGHYGLPGGTLGLALGAGYVAELVGLFAIALVIDRVPRERVFLAGAITVAAGGLVLAAASHPALFVVGLILVGGGFAVWMIPATVLVDRAGSPIPPRQFAAFRIAMDVGMVAGPLLLGSLAELVGSRRAAGFAGVILVAGALALWRRGEAGRLGGTCALVPRRRG